jgi:hypothetical protein
LLFELGVGNFAGKDDTIHKFCGGMTRAKRVAQSRAVGQGAVFTDENEAHEWIVLTDFGDRRQQDVGSLSAFESTGIQNRDEIFVCGWNRI